MWKLIKSAWWLIVSAATLIGIFYIPADVESVGEAVAPWGRVVNVVDQNAALWIFSITLFAYLVWLQAVAPFLSWYSGGRGWLESEEAAKIMFSYLERHDDIRRAVARNKSQSHPLPLSGALAAFFQKGVSEGIIKAKGREDYFDDYKPVPPGSSFQDGGLFGELGDLKEYLAAYPLGGADPLIDLRFKKSSIEAYIAFLKRDASSRNNGKALEQKGGLETASANLVVQISLILLNADLCQFLR
jgi:hypothetical protein